MDGIVDHIELLLLTDRKYPIKKIKLLKHLVEDINYLVPAAQKLNPSLTEDDVIRAIYRLGSRSLRANIARGIAPNPTSLPEVQPGKPDEPKTGAKPDPSSGSGGSTSGD